MEKKPNSEIVLESVKKRTCEAGMKHNGGSRFKSFYIFDALHNISYYAYIMRESMDKTTWFCFPFGYAIIFLSLFKGQIVVCSSFNVAHHSIDNDH